MGGLQVVQGAKTNKTIRCLSFSKPGFLDNLIRVE